MDVNPGFIFARPDDRRLTGVRQYSLEVHNSPALAIWQFVHHLLGVRVYFAFSDENGGYLRIRPAAFVKRFPYFIRSTLLIRAEDWPTLRVRAEGLRALLPALAINEIKWSHI